jgi:hypothetical protein
MPQVIEWTNVGADDIVWRYPVEDITWGAQVNSARIRDGSVHSATEKPTMSSKRATHINHYNLPLITSLLTRLAGFGGNKHSKPQSCCQHKNLRRQMGHTRPNHRACTAASIRAVLVQSRRRHTLRQRSRRRTKSLHHTSSKRISLRGFLNEKNYR